MFMGASNSVLEGDYKGKGIIFQSGSLTIVLNFFKSYPINKTTVDSYEVVDESSQKSVGSAIARGAVGSLLLGPIGVVAAATAKKKGVHLVAIHFKDGKRSLIEIDDSLFKNLQRTMF